MFLCLFNLYTEHITRNAGLDELHAGIKVGGRNINNLRYADDTTLVFLPGESQGRGSLVGCRLWSHTELDTTEAT